MRKVVIVLSLIFLQIQIIIAAKPDDVVGKWRTANGKGVIEIYKSKNGTFEGKVLGGEPRKDKNGNPILTDINNPDPTKRNQTT